MYKSSLKPSVISDNDRRYRRSGAALNGVVDLRPWDSAIEDQGRLGSCSALAMTSAYELMLNQINSYVELSDLFIYYNTRMPLNEQARDTGASLKNTVKSVETYGACAESFWPYSVDRFDDPPSAEAYADGLKRRLQEPLRIITLSDMADCLNSGRPFITGMAIFFSFMYLNADHSVVRMPLTDADAIYDYHAMSIVGYDMNTRWFIAKNSFGTDWGDKGYCYIPFAYAESYMFENWTWNLLLASQRLGPVTEQVRSRSL